MIEVDLLDSDGVAVAGASVDETFWGSYASQATALAAQYGLSVYLPGPPQWMSPSGSVRQFGDWQAFVQRQQIGAKAPLATTGAGMSTAKIATIAAATVLGAALLVIVARAVAAKRR